MKNDECLEMKSHADHRDAAASGMLLSVAKAFFVVFCLEALFSVPFRSVYLLRQSTAQGWMAGIFVLAVVSILWLLRQTILVALVRLLKFPSVGNRAWLVSWLILGLVLRLAWIWRFPVTFKSDHLAY